mgnify:CR=1 FL=1
MTKQPTAAQLIRAELKATFPGFKFSVTSDYNSIRIRWNDGPAPKKIQEITGKYKMGSFNGMEDIYEYTNRNPDLPQVLYIFDERQVSDAVKNQVIADLHLPEEEVNTYTGERRIWLEIQERSYDLSGNLIVAKSEVPEGEKVVIAGEVFTAVEVATTDDDNAADVKNRWMVFGEELDSRTETGQTGYLAEWFSGKYCFWKVGDLDRVILELHEVVFGEPSGFNVFTAYESLPDIPPVEELIAELTPVEGAQKMFSEMKFGELFFAGNYLYEFRYFENGKCAAKIVNLGLPETGTWEHFEGDRIVTLYEPEPAEIPQPETKEEPKSWFMVSLNREGSNFIGSCEGSTIQEAAENLRKSLREKGYEVEDSDGQIDTVWFHGFIFADWSSLVMPNSKEYPKMKKQRAYLHIMSVELLKL